MKIEVRIGRLIVSGSQRPTEAQLEALVRRDIARRYRDGELLRAAAPSAVSEPTSNE